MTLPDPMTLEVQDFGVTVTRVADGTPFRAIIERPYARSLGVGGERIRMVAAIEDITEDPRGEEFEIAGERLAAVDIEGHRGEGALAVQLETRGFLLTLTGDWGLWIDEVEPFWPLLSPTGGDPGEYSGDVLRIRKAAGAARHVLMSIAPIAPQLPAGAIIDRAELRLYAGESFAAPHWATYQVLRSLDPTDSHWTQYRRGALWDVPGAIGAAVDYDPDHVLGSGEGFNEGWSAVASGADFSSLVRAHASGRLALLIWPTAPSPDGQAVLEATGAQLLVWYRKGVA